MSHKISISAQSQCASWAYKGMALTRCCILRGKPNYLQLIHFYCSLSFVLLLLISLSERAHGENCSEKDVLDVKPFNSSHLILKDIKSLKDRYQKECVSQNMTVRNLSARAVSHAAVDKVFELDIDSEGNGLVALDPCFAYTIWLTATVGEKNHSVRFCDTISQKFHYNIPTLEGYPYNNELKSEVINKICRVSEENIMIPELPTSIKSCVFTSGNRTYARKTDNNRTHSSVQSVHVEFEIVDPTSDVQNPQRICIRTLTFNL